MTSPARRSPTRPAALVLWAAASLSACSPAFDWREARPQESGAVMMFPCRPDRQQRTARVDDTALRMQLHSCKASGFTFSLSVADVDDPFRVSSMLAALRQQLVANIAGAVAALSLPRMVGATPNPNSQFLRIEGRLPDGRDVVVHAAFFVKGLRVYQASVVSHGERPGPDTLATFFDSIRLP